MIKVKLEGHEFRYEVFQIVSLFFNKSEIEFCLEDHDLLSKYDSSSSTVECIISTAALKKTIRHGMSVNSSDKRSIKNSIKMTLLKCLEEYTGTSIPWGILVGIRPTKIIHEYIKRCIDGNDLVKHMMSEYSVSEEKARLAVEVAGHEAEYLDTREGSMSVYIGIPFCPTRCSYCSFTSNPIGKNTDLVDLYLSNLIKEIDITLRHLKEKKVIIDTLYVGGGTPTSLSASSLEKLLGAFDSIYSIKNLREVTVEAGRPDSIDMDKLSVIRDSGCRRISINPQTMNDETLRRIGRLHTSSDVIEKYEMARHLGFNNINMDIIIGLPGEGEKEISKTMKALESLEPENITIHTMAVKRASILNEKEYAAQNSNAKAMYEIATKGVKKMGMYPYYMYRQKNMVSPLENVGYCKSSMECIYNIQMIAENISIVSFGADAVTKIVFEKENRIERTANVKDVREYNSRIDEMIENKINAINMLTK